MGQPPFEYGPLPIEPMDLEEARQHLGGDQAPCVPQTIQGGERDLALVEVQGFLGTQTRVPPGRR